LILCSMKPMFTSVLCSAGQSRCRISHAVHKMYQAESQSLLQLAAIGMAQRMSNCVNVDSSYIFSCFPVVLISFLVSLCTIIHRRHKRNSRRRSRTFRPGQSPRRTVTRARAPVPGRQRANIPQAHVCAPHQRHKLAAVRLLVLTRFMRSTMLCTAWPPPLPLHMTCLPLLP
jgi:hypothetical protein